MLHILFVNNLLAYILPWWLFCMLCFRGRAVANVGRTCSPTPLFVLTMYRGNKICLYYSEPEVSSSYMTYNDPFEGIIYRTQMCQVYFSQPSRIRSMLTT